MEDIKILIGRVIRLHREAKKLNQTDAGELFGLSQQQYRRYESGESEISILLLVDIAKAFSIPMGRFFDKVKTDDLIEEFTEKVAKYMDLIDVIEKSPDLEKAIRQYSKYSKNLKDVNLTKIINKLASYPPDKKQTALNILMTGKI